MGKKQLTAKALEKWDGKINSSILKPNPSISESKVIWHKVTEELPEFDDETSIECLVVVQYINDNKLLSNVTSSYYEKTDDGNRWSNVMSSEIVIYWCYMNEIPLPKDLLVE